MNVPDSRRIGSSIAGLTIAMVSLPAWALDTVIAIPEPGTMALLLGAAGCAVLLWRNRKK
jgi:hypothetical protein